MILSWGHCLYHPIQRGRGKPYETCLVNQRIDHWVSQAVASPNKPTPAFLMTQETCIVAVLCTACKQRHYKELCLCPSNLVLLILSSHTDRPGFPQEGHFCLREWLHCMQDKHFSLTFFRESKFLRNSEVDQWGLYDYGCNIFELTVANVSHQYQCE